MQEIDFYCKKCGKSMRISYEIMGRHRRPVMSGVTLKCHICKKVSVMKNYTEERLLVGVDKNRHYYL